MSGQAAWKSPFTLRCVMNPVPETRRVARLSLLPCTRQIPSASRRKSLRLWHLPRLLPQFAASDSRPSGLLLLLESKRLSMAAHSVPPAAPAAAPLASTQAPDQFAGLESVVPPPPRTGSLRQRSPAPGRPPVDTHTRRSGSPAARNRARLP